MITGAVKIQLIIFAIVTVLGGAFVGGRYAQVDRLFVDRSYPVVANFEDSGGIFAGAQVTYRGIAVGKVGKLTFTEGGVDVRLDLENDAPKVPQDVLAVVANKSAIGEQFIDLRPRSSSGPYLTTDSVITDANTQIPLTTTELLIDIDKLVASVDTEALKVLVEELGMAFDGTGRDLTRIIDTQTEFIQTADDNIEVTRAIIRNSSGVLETQIDKQGQLSTFSNNLALFSDTLVDADPDIRRLFEQGSGSAKLLNAVVNENSKDLTSIFKDFRIAGEPVDRLHKGIEIISILYPYLVEGGFSVIAPSKLSGSEGEFDATFGLVDTRNESKPEPERVCKDSNGGREDNEYRPRRDPDELNDIEFNVDADCEDWSVVARNPEKTIINLNRAGVDPTSDTASGKDSWKWLLIAPAMN
ncbi:MCE family protein [Aeromicrobium sp.]|uniref:MCE family protein n=1 Tax=Aeromicrobium sp. TaxID=1871063 RepID=UPI003D6C6E18